MNRFGQAMVTNGTIKDRLKADHLKNTIECIQQLTTTRQRCYIIWMLTLSCQFGIYSCWYCVWTGLVWLGKRSIGPTRMSQTTERPIHTERQIFVKISARNHHSTMKIGTQVVHNYPYGSAGFSWSQTVILVTWDGFGRPKQTQKYEGMYHLVSLQTCWNRILDIKIHICTKWQLGDRLRSRDPDSFVFSWSLSDRSRLTSQPNIRSTPKWICSCRHESASFWSSD